MADLPKIAKPAQRALHGTGIHTLEESARRKEAEIAALHGMGPKAVERLRAALAKRGLRFCDGGK